MVRAFVISGGDVDTLAEVAEEIAHLHEVPETERGTAWYAYRDTLESKRARLTARA